MMTEKLENINIDNNMIEKNVFAAIVGKPNVGKSTLLNKMVGAKIAITSPKPQTTRNRIMGVVTNGETQYVFLDTPGFHVPKTKLGEHMVKSVRDSVSNIDCALFVTYPKDEVDEIETTLLNELKASKTPTILVMNKSDTLSDKSKGQELIKTLCAKYQFCDSALVSALTGDGLDELISLIDKHASEEPHMFPDDTLTDIPEKVIVAELIREKLLTNLFEELPHGCAVSIERFKERADKPFIDIDAEILCEKESHKGMIIGKKGLMLKKIGGEARADIQEFLGCRVNLKLWVKVREDWRNKESFIRNLGYQ
ncbi:MAG: GTPase Era [Oscillospiraceae bacterium]